MKRSQINPLPQFFDRYINLVEDVELVDGLVHQLAAFESYDFQPWEELGDRTYAPDKWTLKDILQHVIDNERVQSYRAMRFARKDTTILPGYDQDLLARNAKASKRSLESLRQEFVYTRKSSILLFQDMDDEALSEKGTAYKVEITPLGLGFQMIGHYMHHFNTVAERYLPLLGN